MSSSGAKVLFVYIFLRVSTLNQAKVLNGSLESQRKAAEQFVKRLEQILGVKLIVKKVYEEKRSAKKGTFDSRDSIIDVRREMSKGNVDIIIFEKLDRFSRDNQGNLRFFDEAQEKNVSIYEIESGKIDITDRSNRFLKSLKSLQNEDYSIELSDKMTRKGRMAMVFSGKDNSTRRCLGLDPDPKSPGYYVVNDSEVKIVKDIMNKFIALKSYKETVMYCDEMGYRTKMLFRKDSPNAYGEIEAGRTVGGKKFNLQRLQRLFRDPKLSGENFLKIS